MTNKEQIESMIVLIQRYRFESDETKLPSDFDQAIHSDGGKVLLGYYENELVNGMDQDYWEFNQESIWKDLWKALQTTHNHCSEVIDIYPKE